MSTILFNDKLIPADEAHISYEDRGYYFGDGIYEVCRVYNGALYETEAHMDRLIRSSEAISLKLPHTTDEIVSMVQKLCEANELRTGIVYFQYTRGVAPRVHYFPGNVRPVLMGFTKPMPRPLKELSEGITALTTPDIRWLRCDIKSLNLLPNTMAKQQAKDQGADEVIFHRDGTVTECSASNVWMVKDRKLRTHPANNLILHGITREVILRLADELKLPVEQEAFTLAELADADEVFLSSTTAEVTPIVKIDGRNVQQGKPGPVTRQLQEAFLKTIPSHA